MPPCPPKPRPAGCRPRRPTIKVARCNFEKSVECFDSFRDGLRPRLGSPWRPKVKRSTPRPAAWPRARRRGSGAAGGGRWGGLPGVWHTFPSALGYVPTRRCGRRRSSPGGWQASRRYVWGQTYLPTRRRGWLTGKLARGLASFLDERQGSGVHPDPAPRPVCPRRL
jgi:hypothetical protein